MKKHSSILTAVFAILFLSQSLVWAAGEFPDHPELAQTPGSLCQNPDTHRYKEQIPYCERSVDTKQKNQIIAAYDKDFGYDIRGMARGDFKIDHFIPLSLGGSNNSDNLWPQHKSIYRITDPLEHILFEKLNAGSITQEEAIRIIKDGKFNLGRVPELIDYVKKLN